MAMTIAANLRLKPQMSRRVNAAFSRLMTRVRLPIRSSRSREHVGESRDQEALRQGHRNAEEPGCRKRECGSR